MLDNLGETNRKSTATTQISFFELGEPSQANCEIAPFSLDWAKRGEVDLLALAQSRSMLGVIYSKL